MPVRAVNINLFIFITDYSFETGYPAAFESAGIIFNYFI